MKRVFFRISYILFALSLFGCSLVSKPVDVGSLAPDTELESETSDVAQTTGCILPDGRYMKIQEPDSSTDTSTPAPEPDAENITPDSDQPARTVHLPEPVYLEIPDEAHIDRCKRYYLEKYRRDYDAGLERRRILGEMIRRKVRRRGLPEALAWIPMVETWFRNEAYSRSHAAGLWQLIPATAKTFGLRIDDWVDERFDPEKATDTALTVLEYLHDRTGDWLLAIAAYNAGEGRVNRAIRRVGSRDYWDLARHRALPSQTRFYVSAVLALAEIDRDPETHDITIPICGDVWKCGIHLDRQISLTELAAACNLKPAELHALNPSMKRAWTPPDSKAFKLYIPPDHQDTIHAYLDGLDRDESHNLVVHVIQPGDTLSDLACHYKSTVDAIMAANQLNKPLIIAGTELLIPAGLTWK